MFVVPLGECLIFTHILFQGKYLKLNSLLKSFSHILFPFLRTQFSFPLQWKSCRHSSPGLEREIYRSIFITDLSSNRAQRPQLFSIFGGFLHTIKFKQKDLNRPPRLVVGGLVVVERVTWNRWIRFWFFPISYKW